MTAKQIQEWRAFARLEPFGAAAEDYRFGKMLSTKYGGAPIKYFPGYDAEEVEEVQHTLRIEEIKARMQKALVNE